MSSETNQTECLKYIEVQCSFYGSEFQFENLLFSIILSTLGSSLLAINTIISVFYIKLKNDTWSYTSLCTLELMMINIATGLMFFYRGITKCFTIFHSRLFCGMIYSSLYFFLLATFKTNFFMAFFRVYLLKYKSKMPWKKYLIAKLVSLVFISFCCFIPTIFTIRNFRYECECTENEFVPNIYVITINFLLLLLAVLTSLCYVYIYFFVKSKLKKVGAFNTKSREKMSREYRGLSFVTQKVRQTSDTNERTKRCTRNNKIKVLRTQVLIFFVLVVSYLPYIISSIIKAIYDVKENTLATMIMDFLSLLMIFDLVFKPVLYTYRLKFMRKLYRHNVS